MGVLHCGADEAGRGPVLGPLVIACVCIREEDMSFLEEMNIRDSKQVSVETRKKLAEIIKSKCIEYNIIEISPNQIDELHKVQSLNVTEVKGFANAINGLKSKPDILYLDAADVIESRFGEDILKLLQHKPKKVISKHKGDAIYRIIGAASILAKTHRDSVIESYRAEFGDIGSGYPSDPNTQKFIEDYIRKHNDVPKIVRTSWKTVDNIKNRVYGQNFSKKQKRLDDFK